MVSPIMPKHYRTAGRNLRPDDYPARRLPGGYSPSWFTRQEETLFLGEIRSWNGS
ncbi:MAG TPA: hypothetical protein VH186_00995 [Chloroflexia bacterium]|nr:hypothetical protein [Chloroflexia bacterium]